MKKLKQFKKYYWLKSTIKLKPLDPKAKWEYCFQFEKPTCRTNRLIWIFQQNKSIRLCSQDKLRFPAILKIQACKSKEYKYLNKVQQQLLYGKTQTHSKTFANGKKTRNTWNGCAGMEKYCIGKKTCAARINKKKPAGKKTQTIIYFLILFKRLNII